MNSICQKAHFALKETELFLSQILHDLISPFSALSAGIDLLAETRPNEELIGMLQCSKQQLYDRLSFFRALFGYGYQAHEGQRLLEEHLAELQCTYTFHTETITKLSLALCFWITKQMAARGGHLTLEETENTLSLVLSQSKLRQNTAEDDILLGTLRPSSPRDTYAFFAKVLLDDGRHTAHIERTENTLSITVSSL